MIQRTKIPVTDVATRPSPIANRQLTIENWNHPCPPLAPRPSPLLIALKGHPATGKSVVAEALARQLGWPLIDKDDIKDHLLDLADANERAYAIMWQVAATQLSLGMSVIAVSPLSYPAGYEMARRIAEQSGARLLVVETVVEEAEWKQRLNARSPTESAHKLRGWDTMQQMLRQYDGCWQYPIAAEHYLRSGHK